MMKPLKYIIPLFLALCTSIHAQDMPNGISIKDVDIEITGEELHINFAVTASHLDMGCNGQMKLEFAIENTDRRLILPVVIYTGTTRYYYERRNQELSGAFHLEPYRVYKGVKKNSTYELDYHMTVPYYSWMEHAAITFSQYAKDCSGDYRVSDGILIADLNPVPVYVEPEMWQPNAALFANLVSFLIPEVEEVKSRASMLELNIGFPVNITEVRSTFGNNQHELNRADSLIDKLQANDLLTVNGLYIRGYASPEGRYAANERLAKGRLEGFKKHLVSQYPGNAYVRNATTSWVAEDWEGLAKLIQNSNLPYKEEVLAVVLDGSMAPDTKEQVLQKIGQWSNVYKPILNDLLPKLRRIELRADYTVQKLGDSKARELLYTHPELLSLEEIYRVARYYEPGSKQYREVYEIAARQYPDDIIANNNAAAALLQEGNAKAAMPYLQKIEGRKESFINYGAYHYITGNRDQAIAYFTKAKEAGVEQADHNLKLVHE